MAITGFMMIGFIIAHLLGNLLVFHGPDALNAYAEKLRELSNLLWLARIVLILAVGAHIWSGIKLAAENRCARPQNYKRHRFMMTSFAARTMALIRDFFRRLRSSPKV